MRILVIGATGTIGSAVADELEGNHEVLRASRHADVEVDIEDPQSIRDMYERVGKLDAVVCCAGNAAFGPVTELDDDGYEQSIQSKLMGQVNLVRYGIDALEDGGGFTLTSGVFAHEPPPGVPAVAMVNGAVESFTRGAALDLPRGLRVNTVSPPWIEETAAAMGHPGQGEMTAAECAKVYAGVIQSDANGEVITANQ